MDARQVVEFVHNGSLIEASIRIAGGQQDLYLAKAAIPMMRLKPARIEARRTRIEIFVDIHIHAIHDGPDNRIIPTLIVELPKPEFAIQKSDGGKKMEAVVRSLAREGIDASGISLLIANDGIVAHHDPDAVYR